MHLKGGIVVVNIYEFLPLVSHLPLKLIQKESDMRRRSSQKDCLRIPACHLPATCPQRSRLRGGRVPLARPPSASAQANAGRVAIIPNLFCCVTFLLSKLSKEFCSERHWRAGRGEHSETCAVEGYPWGYI